MRGARPVWRNGWLVAAVVVAAALAVGLRVICPHADPYTEIDWDTGILTDEGFYSHNARNLVLFGEARLDEFNNMLVSPLMHVLQVVVFRAFGVGFVPLRMTSVVISLLSIPLLFAAVRRAFGTPAAALAALFLALDHTNLLFNRLGLLDTPAALLEIAAFYAFVRAEGETGRGGEGEKARLAWLLLCGQLMGVTIVTRALCLFLVPAPFIALAVGRGSWRAWRRECAAVLAGLAFVGLIYGAIWWWPNMAEIAHMNHYYRTVQVQPHSVARFLHNLRIFVAGGEFGVVTYLVRHTPVVFAFGLLALGARLRRLTPNAPRLAEEGTGQRPFPTRPPHASRLTPAEMFIFVWLLAAWSVLAISSYSPDRYFVTFYPALYTLAAVTLVRLWSASARGRVLAGASVALWAGVNGLWLGHWATTMRYTQVSVERWLEENVPSDAVILGDVAPGIVLDTKLQAVNVQEKLCNDDHPVETWSAIHPAYIAMIDGDWRAPYWVKHYPQIVAPSRRLLKADVVKWWVGIYGTKPRAVTHGMPVDRSKPDQTIEEY